MTNETGAYQFEGVKPGFYHVVQIVPPGTVQTFPGRLPGQPDGLADRVVSLDYVPVPESPVLFGQDAGEKIEVWVGASPDEMVFLNVLGEVGGAGVDLGRFGIDYPIRFVRIKSLNNNGSAPGYDFVGFQAINFQPVSLTAHLVEVKENEQVTDINFGRFGRDLPPRVVISRETSKPRAGEEIVIGVTANDDFDEPTLVVTANGSPVALDAQGGATITTPYPGEMVVTAVATDSVGQTATQSLHVNVLNADGSAPNNPDSPAFESSDSNAPRIVVHSPGAGESMASDTAVVASITHANLSSWKLEYAPVDQIDPYALSLADPDYLPLGDGVASLVNSPAGTFPATTLTDGIYFPRISATANGVTGYSGQVVAVRTDASALYPVIEITSPEQNSFANYLTDIEGTIASESPIREWYVEVADAGSFDLSNLANTAGVAFSRIADGVGGINGKLATLDPTVLKNGTYLVKVTCWNDFGLGWTEGVVVNVWGENKPGRLKIEHVDLEVDLAGVPIRIIRTYDSFEKDRSGDFGAGWAMSLAAPDIRDTDPDGGAPFTSAGTLPFYLGAMLYPGARGRQPSEE